MQTSSSNFTQENFQDRNRHKEGGTAQLLELVCKEGENHYKPSFTIMGFRYATVETDIDLTLSLIHISRPFGLIAKP